MTSKQALESWGQFSSIFLSPADVDPNEPTEIKEARRQRLEADPEQWFSYYFKQYCTASPAQFHKDATQRVIANTEFYEVRIWSRELAKSTRTMLEVLYLTLVGHPADNARVKKKYALLISNSLDNATRLLMPYKTNLECNELLLHDYGQQVQSGSWQAAEFITRSGAAFRALGVGQSPRGARNEEARPDILLFDDIDTDADCLNGDIVRKKWRWIEEAAIGTRSVSQPTTIIFCGNLIAHDSCMARAQQFADHAGIVNIRNDDGLSSWPEKNTEEHIARVLKQKSHASMLKEYFNNPVSEGAVFKQVSWKDLPDIHEYDGLVCYTDPSYSDEGDFKATVLVGKWQDEFHIIACFLEQTTIAQMIQWHIDIASRLPVPCRFYMEQVFMQHTLIDQVNNEARKRGVRLCVQPDNRKKTNKYARIELLLEPLNRNGQLFLNEQERNNPHMQRLEQQFLAFGPGSRSHDDGPDAVEGAIYIFGERTNLDLLRDMEVGALLRNHQSLN